MDKVAVLVDREQEACQFYHLSVILPNELIALTRSGGGVLRFNKSARLILRPQIAPRNLLRARDGGRTCTFNPNQDRRASQEGATRCHLFSPIMQVQTRTTANRYSLATGNIFRYTSSSSLTYARASETRYSGNTAVLHAAPVSGGKAELADHGDAGIQLFTHEFLQSTGNPFTHPFWAERKEVPTGARTRKLFGELRDQRFRSHQGAGCQISRSVPSPLTLRKNGNLTADGPKDLPQSAVVSSVTGDRKVLRFEL
jgi:hypothetical protein